MNAGDRLGQGEGGGGGGTGKGSLDSCLSLAHLPGFLPDAPKEVTTVIQNPMRIREGDTVTLSCNYSSSNPRVTRYEWDFQGFRREDSPGVLIIQKVAWDTMPITCAACNQWCSWAPSVNLDVQREWPGKGIQEVAQLGYGLSGRGDWGLGWNLHKELKAESLVLGPRGEEVMGTGRGKGTQEVSLRPLLSRCPQGCQDPADQPLF